MSVPLYLVLIVAVWIAAAVLIRNEERTAGAWGSGIGCVFYFAAAVIATLAILLSRAWWGVP